jgi:hypothetical protein
MTLNLIVTHHQKKNIQFFLSSEAQKPGKGCENKAMLVNLQQKN